MESLADLIERYIKAMLAQSKDGTTELQRNELALRFACVPSQINYVLSTRFTLDRGYVVESRRGGGGFLKITQLPINKEADLYSLINQSANKYVKQKQGHNLIDRLIEENYLTKREGLLIKAMILDEAIPVDAPKKDHIRANLIKQMLLTIIREDFE